METKVCDKCKTELPISEFNRKRSRPDGLQAQCRPCDKAYLRAWRVANLERKRQMDRDYAASNRERARAKTRQWAAENKERKREADRRYVEENKERLARQSAAYRAENRTEIQTRKASYRVENRERIRQRDREWRQANKGKVLADRTLRKMRKRQATPPWLTKEQRLEMRQAYETAQTFTEALGEPWHVDHIVPISSPVVCGLHVPWNLQIMRGVDNIAKSNRLD